MHRPVVEEVGAGVRGQRAATVDGDIAVVSGVQIQRLLVVLIGQDPVTLAVARKGDRKAEPVDLQQRAVLDLDSVTVAWSSSCTLVPPGCSIVKSCPARTNRLRATAAPPRARR